MEIINSILKENPSLGKIQMISPLSLKHHGISLTQLNVYALQISYLRNNSAKGTPSQWAVQIGPDAF